MFSLQDICFYGILFSLTERSSFMNPRNRIRQAMSVVLILVMLFSSAAFALAEETVIVPDFGEMTYEEAHNLFPDDYPLPEQGSTPVDTTPADTTPVDAPPVDPTHVDTTPVGKDYYRPSHDMSGTGIPFDFEIGRDPAGRNNDFTFSYQMEPAVQPKQPPVWGEGLTGFVDSAITSIDETEAGNTVKIRADESGMTAVSRTMLEKFEERGDVDLVCVYDRFGETMQLVIPAGTKVMEHIGNASFVEFHNLADRLGLTPVPYSEEGGSSPGGLFPAAIPFAVQPYDNALPDVLSGKTKVNVIELKARNHVTVSAEFESMTEEERAQEMLRLQDRMASTMKKLESLPSQIEREGKTIFQVLESIGECEPESSPVVFLPSASDPVNAIDMLFVAGPNTQPMVYNVITAPFLDRSSKIDIAPGRTISFGSSNSSNNVEVLTLADNTVNALVEEGYTGEGLTEEETLETIDSLLADLASGCTPYRQPEQDVSVLLVFEKEPEKVRFEEDAVPGEATGSEVNNPNDAGDAEQAKTILLYDERTADLQELLSMDRLFYSDETKIHLSENAAETLKTNPQLANAVMDAILAIDRNRNQAENSYSFDLGNGETVSFTKDAVAALLSKARERIIYKEDKPSEDDLLSELISALLGYQSSPTMSYESNSPSIVLVFEKEEDKIQFEETLPPGPEPVKFNDP